MAKKELSLLLTVKNGLQVGLAKAKASLEGFGRAAMGVGKWVGGAFIGAGAAIAAFSVKALSAYAEQEKAVNALKSSFRAYGEEVDANTAKVQEYASAIQDETGLSDDNLVARAARLKLLGVETDAIQGALKATVALAAAGMEEEAAIKAVAQAREGNFTALSKYIPAIRSAVTEQDKLIVLNDFLSAGYKVQADQLNTVSGQWNNFKERVGDVWEEIGKVIAQNGLLTKVLDFAAEKAKAFGLAITEWAESERFQEIQASIEGIVNAMVKGGEGRTQALGLLSELLQASLARGAEIAGEYLKSVAPVIGKLIGAGAKAAMGTVAKQNSLKAAADEMGIDTGPMFGAFGGFMGDVTAEQKKQIEIRAEQLRQEELFRDLGLDVKSNIEGQSAAQTQLANATTALLELGKEYAGVSFTTAKAAVTNTENMIKLSETAAQRVVESAEERGEVEQRVADEVTEANEQAADAVSTAWSDGYSSIAEASIEAADTSIKSAQAIKDSMNASMPSGGTVTSSSDYREAKLRAAGIDPNRPSGGVLSANDAANLKNVTQDQILRELQKMNQNQEKLLTYA